MLFTKMHGAGNDFSLFDGIHQELPPLEALAQAVCDRHFGAGGDGIMVAAPSEAADVRMIYHNSDGSLAGMCGNGIRCFSRFVYEKGLTDKTEIDVETLAGIKHVVMNEENGKITGITVNMGQPVFTCADIPVLFDGEEMVNQPITIGGMNFRATCVSMGNPHCVVYVDDVDNFPLEDIGPRFEINPLFPDRVNTEFVRRLPDGSLQMRVWERGSGETWACGTGACAVLASSVRNGVIDGRRAVVHLRGGDLDITWDEASGSIFMTGGADFVFDGQVEV